MRGFISSETKTGMKSQCKITRRTKDQKPWRSQASSDDTIEGFYSNCHITNDMC